MVHIEVVESHEDGESKKGPQLIDSNWTPLLVRLLSHDKLGVLVALTYYCFLLLFPVNIIISKYS